jgi:hypothetical protein
LDALRGLEGARKHICQFNTRNDIVPCRSIARQRPQHTQPTIQEQCFLWTAHGPLLWSVRSLCVCGDITW